MRREPARTTQRSILAPAGRDHGIVHRDHRLLAVASAFPDPVLKGAVDVSECFDNAMSANTSLSTGKIITSRVQPGNLHYYRNTDVVAAVNGRWQVVSMYPVDLDPTGEGVQAMRRWRGGGLAALVLAGTLLPLAAAGRASAGAGVGCTVSTCSVQLQRPDHAEGRPGRHGQRPGPHRASRARAALPMEAGRGRDQRQPVHHRQFGGPPGHARSTSTSRCNRPGSCSPASRCPRAHDTSSPVNPAASRAAQRACFKLPLFVFDVPGPAPPNPPVPPRTLADYAYNHMTVPSPG